MTRAGSARSKLRRSKSEPLSQPLVTLAGLFSEAGAIQNSDLAASACDQTRTLELAERNGDCRPLHTEHVRKQGLRDEKSIPITPVMRGEKPACQALIQLMRGITGARDESLIEKRVRIVVHQRLEVRQGVHRRRKGAPRQP